MAGPGQHYWSQGEYREKGQMPQQKDADAKGHMPSELEAAMAQS